MSSLVKLLTEDDIEPVSQSMAMAFMNDPLQTYVFPDAEERREKSPAHFAALLRYGLLFGEVYMLSNGAGAVVWLTPGNTEVTPEKAEAGSLSALPALLGEEAAQRFFTVIDYADPFHKKDAPEPHWYTMVIGIAPSFCGQGYGRALMQPVMEKAQTQQTPIYLETAEPSNVHFYTRLGFQVIRELVEPVSGLPLWTFKKSW
jgi:ribosomal protein S18 acetylase RimI-like enzyme